MQHFINGIGHPALYHATWPISSCDAPKLLQAAKMIEQLSGGVFQTRDGF